MTSTERSAQFTALALRLEALAACLGDVIKLARPDVKVNVVDELTLRSSRLIEQAGYSRFWSHEILDKTADVQESVSDYAEAYGVYWTSLAQTSRYLSESPSESFKAAGLEVLQKFLTSPLVGL